MAKFAEYELLFSGVVEHCSSRLLVKNKLRYWFVSPWPTSKSESQPLRYLSRSNLEERLTPPNYHYNQGSAMEVHLCRAKSATSFEIHLQDVAPDKCILPSKKGYCQTREPKDLPSLVRTNHIQLQISSQKAPRLIEASPWPKTKGTSILQHDLNVWSLVSWGRKLTFAHKVDATLDIVLVVCLVPEMWRLKNMMFYMYIISILYLYYIYIISILYLYYIYIISILYLYYIYIISILLYVYYM